MEAMINIQHLRKQYGIFTAVDDLSFQVKRGEVLGFLGPNGAGKSTTMKMITGFLTPTAGKIYVAGQDIERHPQQVKRCIGYLPEGAPAYPDMTPLAFLDFIADIRGLCGAEKEKRITETIDQVNLEKVLHQPIDTLSKGYKRRVGLAQAILHNPDVLILDEPTDGLDPNQKHEVRALIKKMATEKVIILSTHILEEVHAVCTRAIIIANGKIVADGTPTELEATAAQHNTVTLTVRIDATQTATVQQALQALPSIDKLEILTENTDFCSYQLYPKEKRSIVAEVSHCLRINQWEILELHVNRGQLDEVFRTITTA